MSNTAQPNPTHWLDVMPALPLARAVPIVMQYCNDLGEWKHCYMQDQRMRDALTTTVRGDSTPLLSAADFLAEGTLPRRIRVDLDDPQGFGYALRYLLQSVANEDLALRHYGRAWATAQRLSMDYAVLRGETTDADRFALAQALAEVSR